MWRDLINASEIDYISENYLIEIIPSFHAEKICLVSGEYGPFKPNKIIKIPLWLAVKYRTNNQCKIIIPSTYENSYLNGVLESEKENKTSLFDLPPNFFEISNILFNNAEDDFEDIKKTRCFVADIKTKDLINNKKKSMVEDLNKFKKIYYKDYMINKHSLEKIYKISNENNIFLNHFSGFNKYYDNQNQNKILNDIQLEYKKKMGFAPIIKDNGNLFSNSILLQNDKDLKQYISLDLDTIKNDSNSLSFLKNIQNKIKLNKIKDNNHILNQIGNKELFDTSIKISNNPKTNNSGRIEDNTYESIKDLKDQIIKAKESFNSMDNLNLFLSKNNQKCLNEKGNLMSRKNSGEASTRMNSGVKKLDIKINNSNTENINLNRKRSINNRIKEYKKKSEDIIQISDSNTKDNKNHNSLILPFIKNNKERTKTLEYIKLTEPTKFESKKNTLDLIKKKQLKKKMNLRKYPNNLEKLYEKISKTENSTDHNNEIKNYLKRNNYEIDDKINGKDLYKSVDKTRKKIIDKSSIQKNYDLMVNNKFKSFEQKNEINQYNDKMKKNIENIEERMIGLLCNVNKYEDN